MNNPPRKVAKNNVQKDFFKLMNNSVFGKTVKNVRKHRDNKLMKIKKLFGIRVSKCSTESVRLWK